MKTEYVMQLTFRNGIHSMVGVSNFEEYKQLKKKIIHSRKRYIDLIPQLTFDKKEVVLIEFFTNEIKAGETNGKD